MATTTPVAVLPVAPTASDRLPVTHEDKVSEGPADGYDPDHAPKQGLPQTLETATARTSHPTGGA